jgi:class 3 adenylate cyclase/predicted ATPase
MLDVQKWLTDMGLSQYALTFSENLIDFDVLPDLTEDDLRELGLPMGPRKKLLKAIAALQTELSVAENHDEPPLSLRAAEAERRQLTVMFCDLVGSTELSTRLDPEDLQDVITVFQDKCRKAIQQYAGFIARYMGDGILVYFGYPQAHEDDAQRAVRAGLNVIDAVADLNAEVERTHGVVLEVRTGIETGQVVVGDLIGEGASEEAAVVGETPNLTARLQGLAQPNQLVIGPATRRLLDEFFELKDLGTHKLKGIDEPVRAWCVVCVSDVDGRNKAKRIGSGMPLFGRQEELGLLLRSWDASMNGHGQSVLIQGEAGIGKSRLIEALREQVSGNDHIWITLRCSPYHANSTLHPIIEHLKRVMGWQQENSIEERLEKLEIALAAQRLPLEKTVPLYAELMSLELPENRYSTLALSAVQQREQTLDALAGWLLEEAERSPVLVVWEDLHWADPTTLELLGICIEQAPTVSMLNVLVYRPVFVPPWPQRSHMTPITLTRLELPEVYMLIMSHTGGKKLPEDVVEHIVDKADGVPLFVEELTKAILESDLLREGTDHYTLTGALSKLAIPATLQDSLMARLDRLPGIRKIAQLGAVLGREFSYSMMLAISPVDEANLQDGLDQLVGVELLYVQGRRPQAKYIFKHALIQDAAYHSLLRRSRQQYHQQSAEALEADFPETVKTHPELLAHHYTEAGLAEPAIGYWLRAGEQAVKRSANLESIAHCIRGLDCVKTLSRSPALDRQELALQITIGAPLIATKGLGAPEAAAHYHRARELCEQLKESHQLLPVIYGQWLDSAAHGDYRTARGFGEELLHFAEQQEELGPVVVGHRTIAWIDLLRGELSSSQFHVDQGLSLYDEEQQRALAVQYAHDSKVTLLGCRACLEWLKGYPEKALETSREAIAHARHLNHAASLAYALCYSGVMPMAFRRESIAVVTTADELIELSENQAFPLRNTVGTVFRGWSLAHGGRAEEGINLMQGALADLDQASQNYALTFYFALLIDATLANGMVQESLRTLDKAFDLVERTGERWWEAELHRLEGQAQLLSKGGDLDGARKSFQAAIEISRTQGAKMLELRAVTNLSSLLADQCVREEAFDLLAPVYEWFTEGFESTDLREAKLLLDALS